MSGWGTFDEIDDGAKAALSSLKTKEAWYAALSEYLDPPHRELSAKQAMHGWAWAFRDPESLLHPLFQGDLRTPEDGTGDPNVVFLGKDLVRTLAVALRDAEDAFIEKALVSVNANYHIWLLEPLRSFFATAASNNRAIVALWGD